MQVVVQRVWDGNGRQYTHYGSQGQHKTNYHTSKVHGWYGIQNHCKGRENGMGLYVHSYLFVCVCVCVCKHVSNVQSAARYLYAYISGEMVCVCVCVERERERERQTDRESSTHRTLFHQWDVSWQTIFQLGICRPVCVGQRRMMSMWLAGALTHSLWSECGS